MDYTAEFSIAYANVITEHGVEIALVDLAITRAITRPHAARKHVLAELRTAAAQDRVQRLARSGRAAVHRSGQ